MKLLRHARTLCAEAGRQRRFQPILGKAVESAVFYPLLNQRIHFRLQGRLVLFQTNKARRIFQHKARHRRFIGVLPGDGRHHQVTGSHILHLTGKVVRNRDVKARERAQRRKPTGHSAA